MMRRRVLLFTAPHTVTIDEEPLRDPAAGEIVVQTTLSAISAGTELLVYRNEFPSNMSVDATIAGMGGGFAYPLAYGYAAVGIVEAVGAGVSSEWLGRRVFAFQPHASHFITTPDAVIVIPDEVSDMDAVFAPNMETAINLVQDTAPLLGEVGLVLGQGIVGLLTTALLAQFPLADLITVDTLPTRLIASAGAGAHHPFAPYNLPPETNADFTLELSGNPAALNTAVQHTRYSGRVIVGSWYGQKRAALDLGGAFHRSRIQISSSQVSTIAPSLAGRWDKVRRFDLVWAMLQRIHPERWISHRVPLDDAAAIYEQLHDGAEDVLQVVLVH